MKNYSERYATFVVNYRKFILAIFILLIATAGYFIPDIKVLNDPDTFLPQNNRYVVTNAYGEHKFGFGNLMVAGLVLKKCVGGHNAYEKIDSVVGYDPETGVRMNESSSAKMTRLICKNSGGTWQDDEDIYQPWFINLLQELHHKMSSLPYARPINFLDISAQKVKYMGTSEAGGLKFERLVPIEGISTVPAVAKKQLAHLKKGLETNPVLAPMLLLKQTRSGKRCEFGQEDCTARGLFIIGDYSDGVKEDYVPWITKFNRIVEEVEKEYGDRVEVRIAGEPYFLASMLDELIKHWWLFVISLLIVILALRYFNKYWSGAILAFLCVMSSIILTLGLMGYTQFKLTTMMTLTPLLILAIGTGHAVQIYRRYLSYLYHQTTKFTPLESAEKAIARIITPATIAIFTDAVGFFTLSFVDISFYQAYAYFGMFGMFSILLAVTTILPLVSAMITPKKVVIESGIKQSFVHEKMLGQLFTSLITTKLRFIPISILVFVLAWSAYYTELFSSNAQRIMPGVETGINYAQAAFKYDAPINIDLRRLNDIMPGVISVNIPIKGIIPLLGHCFSGVELPQGVQCWDEDEDPAQGIFNNAEVLSAIEKTEDWMRAHPSIGFTGSYVQFLKMVNMLIMTPEGQEPNLDLFHIPSQEFIEKNLEFYGDPEDKNYIPNANEIVTSFNGLLETSTSDGDLASFVSRDFNEGLIMGFVNTMNPKKTQQVVKDIQDFFEQHQDEPGFNIVQWGYKSGNIVQIPNMERLTIENDNSNTVSMGGFLGATQATNDIANKEWLLPPLITILAVFLIISLIFRSFFISGMLVLLLSTTLFAQYGLGGYFTSVGNWSGNLHFGTLVSLSIAIGIGVDYGIYMIARFKEEMNNIGNWEQALTKTFETTGSSILISILILLASFIPLFMTDLANTWALGVYISGALIINMLFSLTILPLFIHYFRPKYIFK